MKKLLSLLAVAAMTFTLSSCEKDDYVDPYSQNTTGISGIYVLNYGSWGGNDSTLSFNDGENTLNYLFYSANNGQKLGSDANDMVVYGEKIFITLTGSDLIYVTDLYGKIITSIKNVDYQSPRDIILYNGKIYVTYYCSTDPTVSTGGVAMIDPQSYEVTSAVAGGSYPEGLAVAYGKLYVANSGYGDGTTLSVYDPSTLAYEKNITVPQNPSWLAATEDGSKLYLLTLGTYNADLSYKENPQLHSITSDGTVASLGSPSGMNPGEMAMSKDNKLQVLCGGYDANWNYVGAIYTYNATSGTLEGEFVKDGTTLSNPYKISASTSTGEVALLTSPHGSTGSAIIFDAAGKKTNSFDVGSSPIKACFVE